ncbi:hypothetical protein BJ742DRAFT_407857 [Cladochytrium replicatum]|nr:hypothetical protein BJ742DRAFT_407857 [Cladochytrium replicatum]
MAIVSRPVADIVGDASKRVVPMFSAAKDYTLNAARMFHTFLGKYPPLKMFVYSVVATSAIPIATFIGFTSLTLGGTLAFAGTGVALVQGGILAFCGFILFWFLVGAFILACIASFWLCAIWLALQIGKRVEESLK